MSILHGKAADIYWDSGGTDTQLTQGQSWGVDITHDVAEKTSMGDTFKTYLGGFQDWTATVTCLLPATGANISLDNANDPNGMADVKAHLELYFTHETSDYKAVYGDAICNGISFSGDKDGVPTVTYSFQGTAQIKWWSDTTEPTY